MATKEEKIAALKLVSEIANEDQEKCFGAELFEDAETARQAGKWCDAMIREILREGE